MRANGVPASAQRAGFQSTADLSGVNFIRDADNAGLVSQENFPTHTTYARLPRSGAAMSSTMTGA